MRQGLFAIAVLCGCSLSSAGLSSGDLPLDEAGIDASVAADSSTTTTDSASIFEADLDDSARDAAAMIDTSAADTFAPDTLKPDTAKPDAPVDAGCKASPTAVPCTEIPRREELAMGQVMDGRADDFCDVPYVVFNNKDGVLTVPSPVPASLQSSMTIRVAWSSFGMHLHLAVVDSKIQVATDNNLWQGDSAEIYIAGYDALTGEFDGATKDPGAVQIIFAPTAGATSYRAANFYMGNWRGNPAPDRYFSRNTASGYEIEIRLPWGDIKPTTVPTPAAGKRVALSFGYNQKQDGQKAFAIYQLKTTTPFGSCTQPFCDDRFWCTPVLNP